LNNARFDKDIIEEALAHQEANAARGAYNHADYLEERRKMMHWWSGFLDREEQGAHIIPIRLNRSLIEKMTVH